MQVTEELMQAIKRELESVQYGSVTIQVQDTNPNVDIITEKRMRMKKDEKYHKG